MVLSISRRTRKAGWQGLQSGMRRILYLVGDGLCATGRTWCSAEGKPRDLFFSVPLVPVHTKRLVVNRGTLHSHEHFSTFEAPGEF